MLEGITVAFIFSLTLFPGTVWLAKVGVAGTKQQVLAVGVAFWLSHLVWLVVAVVGLMMMYAHLTFAHFGMHLFASFVLGYMALKFFRSKRVERIDDAGELPSAGQLYQAAFNQSLAMPLRLPAAMAILLSTGVYVSHAPERAMLPSIMLGVVIGLTWWWGQFTFIAAIFAKRVPYPITIKSLNKLRFLCALLCVCLAGIVLFLGL